MISSFIRLSWCIVIVLLATGCDGKSADKPAPPKNLSIFAAASLTESFRDIGHDFQIKHPGVTLTFNFAGSQQLREQLSGGAAADVFASANRKEMDAAKSAALVDPDSIHIFAKNRLIIIFPKNNPAHLATPSDLAKKGIRLDLADPAVPVGKYTLQTLDTMNTDANFGSDFKAKVLANVVSPQGNVKAVVTKVRLGEADAGMVYVTDVTPDAAKDLGTLDVPDRFNLIADYPIALSAKAKQSELARQFIDYVLSVDGQQTLTVYGFLPAVTPTTLPSTTQP